MNCLLKYFVFVYLALVIVQAAAAMTLPNLTREEEHKSQTKLLHRVKRQYFKPSVDGNILGPERKITQLRANKALVSNSFSPVGDQMKTNPSSEQSLNDASLITAPPSASSSNDSSSLLAQSNNAGNGSKYNDLTVTSLALSLINLFDRVKSTLCEIIGQSCHHQLQQSQQPHQEHLRT